MKQSDAYLMENDEEALRLEIKTNPEAVRDQARWCGVRPGLRVLDVGCGPGRTTSILHEMVKPGGKAVGVDFSPSRIQRATDKYGREGSIEFRMCDFTKPMPRDLCDFDLIWLRFVLEYHRKESGDIIKNIDKCLNPGGSLCLLDLDHNCLNHFELPPQMEEILYSVVNLLERKHNFDPFIGRKLYAYLFDMGYRDIRVDVRAHHLIYGNLKEPNMFNWTKKMEMASKRALDIFEAYPGGHQKFFSDFTRFFADPRRFTYTPLILCRGIKPF